MQSLRREIIVGSLSFLFCSILLIYYVVQYRSMTRDLLQNSLQTTTGSQQGQNINSTTLVLNAVEVAKHATQNDCWIIVSGSVYVVTDYLALHPGGVNQIVPYCGQDASTAFATQGGKGSHSQNASADLSRLIIGTLNENATFDLKQIQKAAQSIPVRQGEEEDDE